MNQEFVEALRLLEKERGIEMETLISAIEDALVAAYRREFEIRSKDRDKGVNATPMRGTRKRKHPTTTALRRTSTAKPARCVCINR
jgi:hypothetical protein